MASHIKNLLMTFRNPPGTRRRRESRAAPNGVFFGADPKVSAISIVGTSRSRPQA
jgi:hypothetical protein